MQLMIPGTKPNKKFDTDARSLITEVARARHPRLQSYTLQKITPITGNRFPAALPAKKQQIYQKPRDDDIDYGRKRPRFADKIKTPPPPPRNQSPARA